MATFTAGVGTNDAADTLLFEPAPTTNYAGYAGWEIGSGPPGTGREHVAARFDVSAIPAGATITSATLRLQPRTGMTYKVDGAPTVKLYAVLAANSDWAVASATWNARRAGPVAWAGAVGCGLAGTDYQTTELGSSSAFVHGASAAVDIALSTSVVAGWLTANYGFLVRGADETGTSVRVFDIASANDGTAARRPLLTIEYTTGSPPAGAQRWTGSAWTATTVKRWDGSAWQTATVKRWDGTGWV